MTGPATRRASLVVSLALLSAGALTGCNAAADRTDGGSPAETPTEKTVSDASLTANVKPRRPVAVDRKVTVRVAQGTLTAAELRTADGATTIPGQMSDDQASWSASQLLEPGTTYRLTATAEDSDGLTKRLARTFSTDDLTLDEQTYPSIAPLDGETVGVGMPVIMSFDVPVTDHAAFERRMSVETKPQQKGTWHWISDNEAHWRPKTYWRPGTDVTVRADVNSVDAGNGVYGQEDRVSHFTIGSSLIMRIDVAAHHMKVVKDGRVLRTIPISAGKPGFVTRSGVKVIIEKFRRKRMDAATTGISRDDPEYYNLSNVEYAQRVTYSGEFLHAAPWSVGSQGSANVSHGCVGMSTSDAAWLYSLTRRGDVVEVTGSGRPMEATNGYGDWNVPWQQYREGSALR